MRTPTSPLVPSVVDLRDFPFMPVDIVRLLGSEFHTRANDSEWRAGVTLWMRSYHQVPAASLPNDDDALCRLADLGRDLKTWRKVKANALHGWIECSDGRLYHKVVAEKALEAWLEKLAQRKASGAGNAKRWNAEFDGTEIEAQIGVAAGLLKELNPNSRSLAKRMRQGSQTQSQPHPTGIPEGPKDDPIGSAKPIPEGSQETGTGKRQGKKEKEPPPPAPRPAPAAPGGGGTAWPEFGGRTSSEAFDELYLAAGTAIDDPNRVAGLASLSVVHGWCQGGADFRLDVVDTIRAIASTHKGDPISSWDYFGKGVLRSVSRRKRATTSAAESRADAPAAAAPIPLELTPDRLTKLASVYVETGSWPRGSIDEPGTPTSPITAEMIATARAESAERARRMVAMRDEGHAA